MYISQLFEEYFFRCPLEQNEIRPFLKNISVSPYVKKLFRLALFLFFA